MARLIWIGGVLLISCSMYVLYLYGIFGVSAAILTGSTWSLLTWIIAHYDAAMRISSTAFGFLGRFNDWAERKSVSNYLQGTINEASRSINEGCKDVLPHGIQIRWVTTKDRDSFIKEGKVIVCMEHHINEAKNLARATFLFVAEGLIPESQPYVDKTVMQSAVFTTARKMVMSQRRNDAMKILNEDFLAKALEKNPELQECFIGMEQADTQGLFDRVLLRELRDLGPRLYPRSSDPDAEQDTKTLAEKVIDLASKEEGIDVYPDVRGKVMRVSIMQVARSGRTLYDVEPYLRFVKSCAAEAVDSLYVVARDVRNIVHARHVIEVIEAHKLYKTSQSEIYDVRRGNKIMKSMVAFMTRC